MKTDFLASRNHFFQYLKYLFHWKQFFHLLQIYFRQILHYSQWQRIFCLVETIFFHSRILVGGQYLTKKFLISARGNRFLQFMQILIRMEVLFGLVKSHFSRKPSFWLVETDVQLITNFVLLSASGHNLEIWCKSVFFDFFCS